ncbi:hypothetical protein ACHAP5_002774 [Fusarium lateritium]
MADIERKRQNGQEAEATETSGLGDQKEISVASSTTSTSLLARADVPSGQAVSGMSFVNSNDASASLLSCRFLIFLAFLTFASGLLTSSHPELRLIAFPSIMFTRWIGWV